MTINTHVKGAKWRHAVEAWFSDAGFQTTVRGIGWPGDDVFVHRTTPIPLSLSVECKNHKDLALASFVDQAVAQAGTYPELSLPVVVAHRRGRAEVDDAYVVMPGWAFLELVTR